MRGVRAYLMARSFRYTTKRQGKTRAARIAGSEIRRVCGVKAGKRTYSGVAQDGSDLIQHASPAWFCEIKRITRQAFTVQPAFKHCEIPFFNASGVFLPPPMPRGIF